MSAADCRSVTHLSGYITLEPIREFEWHPGDVYHVQGGPWMTAAGYWPESLAYFCNGCKCYHAGPRCLDAIGLPPFITALWARPPEGRWP
jgi:hypothetical protein